MTYKLRENEWDRRAFGFPVTEILELPSAAADLGRALAEIDARNRALGARVCIGRHDASNLDRKRALLEAGFVPMETAFEAVIHPAPSQTVPYAFAPAAPAQQAELGDVVAEDFRYSRFHEDPRIPRELAAARYRNWVSDLVAAGACRVTLSEEGAVRGFYAVEDRGPEWSLCLIGRSSRFPGTGRALFESMLADLAPRAQGKPLAAVFSAANVAVVNIYARLGFTFRKTTIDYHKWY